MRVNEVKVSELSGSIQKTVGETVFKKTPVYLIAECSGQFLLEKLPLPSDKKRVIQEELSAKGLEIRIFNEYCEAKWIRSRISDPTFFFRITEEETKKPSAETCWDEDQYLDIDLTRSKPEKEEAVTTGGGHYHLPLSSYWDAQVRIRNYISYEKDTGRAYIRDWRVVCFLNGGRK